MRLRGGLTQCLIRRLDAAQFGPEKQPAHDITIDFQATLSGTAQTQHTSDGATDIRKSGGHALTLVLEAPPGDESQEFMLVNDPSNTGAHVHASPLQMRPTLGASAAKRRCGDQTAAGGVRRPRETSGVRVAGAGVRSRAEGLDVCRLAHHGSRREAHAERAHPGRQRATSLTARQSISGDDHPRHARDRARALLPSRHARR